MDDETLRAAFVAHIEGHPMLTRRHIINLADMADVRPMSMVWRLEKLGLAKPGSYDWFKSNGGITARHIEEARSNRAYPTPA